jgi:hypothetical protein
MVLVLSQVIEFRIVGSRKAGSMVVAQLCGTQANGSDQLAQRKQDPWLAFGGLINVMTGRGPRLLRGGVGRVGWGLPLGTIGRSGQEHLLPQTFSKPSVPKNRPDWVAAYRPLDGEGIHCRSSQWCQHI